MSLPGRSLPGPSVPGRSLPGPSVPGRSVPGPSRTVPQAGLPQVSEPQVSEPQVSEPQVSEPQVSEPGVSLSLAALPARIELTVLPTPLLPAPRLGAAMGIECLHVKRDDLTGFAFGGNKARPLEFLIGAASGQGADTIVTGGAAGSNFCAAAAAAALRCGLACHLVIAGRPSQHSPGLGLARSWGATVRWTNDAERASVDGFLPRAAAELAAGGRRPYLIPRGGATALGAIGYALAAAELHDQLAGRGLRASCVLVAVGSGGTLAGLIAGNALLGRPWRLVGASVSRPPAEAARRVLELATECASLLAAPHPGGPKSAGQVTQKSPGGGGARGETANRPAPVITAADMDIVDARGPGHGVASADGNRAADAALRTEGLVVDPVYTAKALAVLGRLAGERTAVFWHTGGLLDVVAAAEADWR